MFSVYHIHKNNPIVYEKNAIIMYKTILEIQDYLHDWRTDTIRPVQEYFW